MVEMTGKKQEDCESHVSLGCTLGPGTSSVEGLPSMCEILNLSQRTIYKVITWTGWILLNRWCVRVYTDMMKYEVARYMKPCLWYNMKHKDYIHVVYKECMCALIHWNRRSILDYFQWLSDIYSLYYSVYASICKGVVTKSYTDYWFHVYRNYPMDILKPQ